MKRRWKRIVSAVLALITIFSLLPATAMADEAPDVTDLNGRTFAIVNKENSAAMLADAVSETDNNRSARQVFLRETADGSYEVICGEESAPGQSQMWTFERVSEGENKDQYYISTTVGGETKYLKIGNENDPVTLVSEKTKITVTGKDKLFRLSNDSGYAVNLFGGAINQGFGSYNDNKENEWQALCTVTVISPSSVEGVSPLGTTIDLFDYWLTGENEDDGQQQIFLDQSGNATRGSTHTAR